MPWSTSNRFGQNVAHFFFSPPLGKSLNIIEEHEGLSLVDTSFAPRDSPRPLNKKLAMSPSSIGHGGQHDTKYSPFDWILRVAFAEEKIWGGLCEPASYKYFRCECG